MPQVNLEVYDEYVLCIFKKLGYANAIFRIKIIMKSVEVPTLTKKQLKNTLSSKKPKQIIKNVLASPYKNDFWPELSIEHQKKLERVLEHNLPRMKPEKINIPWRDLKNIPKSDRNKFRIEYIQKLNKGSPTSSESQYFIMGVNDITKKLEHSSLSAILIASDVQPKLMVQHIIDLAVLKKVPLLIVPHLRTLTKTYCGIRSVALGIEEACSEAISISNILNCIRIFFNNIPPPSEHFNFDRSQNFRKENEPSENQCENVDRTSNEIVPNEDQLMNSVYLKIKENQVRSFIPEPKKSFDKLETSTMDMEKYISLSNKSKNNISKKYKSLKVKCLKSDSLRTKKKIKTFKRR